MSIGFRFTESD